MEILRNLKVDGAENKTMLADVFFNMDGFNKPVVLFNHGFKGFKDWGIWNLVAKQFANEGFVFIKFNQSHNGTNEKNAMDFVDLEAFGRNTFSKELFDINAMFQWIKNNPVLPSDLMNPLQINLLGHSKGGSTAIIAAAQNKKFKSVATWAAYKSIQERYTTPAFSLWKQNGVVHVENSRTQQKMPLYYEIYEDYLANETQFNIEKACNKLQIPQLIVHGTEDATVIFQDALKLKAWNKNSELFLIPNANHVFGGMHPYNEHLLPSHAQLAVKETARFFKLH